MRRMVSLGIESGRESQDLGGTELDAKTTGFTALNNDVDASFCHLNPHGLPEPEASGVEIRLSDVRSQRGVTRVTDGSEVGHRVSLKVSEVSRS